MASASAAGSGFVHLEFLRDPSYSLSQARTLQVELRAVPSNTPITRSPTAVDVHSQFTPLQFFNPGDVFQFGSQKLKTPDPFFGFV